MRSISINLPNLLGDNLVCALRISLLSRDTQRRRAEPSKADTISETSERTAEHLPHQRQSVY